MTKKSFTRAAILIAAIMLGFCAIVPCGQAQTIDMAIRQRAHIFTKAMLDGKYDEAVKLVDPEMVSDLDARNAVRDKLKETVSTVKGINQLFGRKISSFAIHKIDLADDKTHATVHMIYYTTNAYGGDRVDNPTDQEWNFKDKNWYWQK